MVPRWWWLLGCKMPNHSIAWAETSRIVTWMEIRSSCFDKSKNIHTGPFLCFLGFNVKRVKTKGEKGFGVAFLCVNGTAHSLVILLEIYWYLHKVPLLMWNDCFCNWFDLFHHQAIFCIGQWNDRTEREEKWVHIPSTNPSEKEKGKRWIMVWKGAFPIQLYGTISPTNVL